jgi:hypothetical protein
MQAKGIDPLRLRDEGETRVESGFNESSVG